MIDDDQGVRKPAATSGGTHHEDRGDVRSHGDGGPPDDRQVLIDSDVSQDGDKPVDVDGAEPSREKKPDKKKGSFWRDSPVLIGVALVLALVIKAFAVQAFYIPSQSMENTLKVGDRVLVNKIVYHTRDIKRGDIVVFNGLDSWDPEVQYTEPTNPVQRVFRAIGRAFGVVPGEKDYIKRVIGVPGDHVACCDKGRVTVNGHPLEEQSYLYPGNEPSDRRFDATVPQGRLWVMGDHRVVSSDSRAHLGDQGGGTVPESRVIGRAFVIVWPISRATTLPIPETFQQQALAAANTVLPAAPLALGLVGAVPLTLLQRRWRLRRALRRSAA